MRSLEGHEISNGPKAPGEFVVIGYKRFAVLIRYRIARRVAVANRPTAVNALIEGSLTPAWTIYLNAYLRLQFVFNRIRVLVEVTSGSYFTYSN